MMLSVFKINKTVEVILEKLNNLQFDAMNIKKPTTSKQKATAA